MPLHNTFSSLPDNEELIFSNTSNDTVTNTETNDETLAKENNKETDTETVAKNAEMITESSSSNFKDVQNEANLLRCFSRITKNLID